MNEDNKRKFPEALETKIDKLEDKQMTYLEELWQTFKKLIIDAAEKVYGKTNNCSHKCTPSWNKEIKQEGKLKKQLWSTYLNKKGEENYKQYQKQRKKVKEKIAEAKKRLWEDFGNKMQENNQGNAKLLFRTLKSTREEKEKLSDGLKIKIETYSIEKRLQQTDGRNIIRIHLMEKKKKYARMKTKKLKQKQK